MAYATDHLGFTRLRPGCPQRAAHRGILRRMLRCDVRVAPAQGGSGDRGLYRALGRPPHRQRRARTDGARFARIVRRAAPLARSAQENDHEHTNPAGDGGGFAGRLAALNTRPRKRSGRTAIALARHACARLRPAAVSRAASRISTIVCSPMRALRRSIADWAITCSAISRRQAGSLARTRCSADSRGRWLHGASALAFTMNRRASGPGADRRRRRCGIVERRGVVISLQRFAQVSGYHFTQTRFACAAISHTLIRCGCGA